MSGSMLPSRVTTRLKDFDYAQPGAYFVTTCCHQRRLLFGSVRSASFHASPLGFLVQELWHSIPKHHGNVAVDTFQAMPNHVHGVIFIRAPKASDNLPPAASLGSILGGYKSAVSREAGKLGIKPGVIWDSRYYDHVVRHERALQRIREYITNNPLQWSLDRENPDRSGLNEFYAWIEQYSRQTSPAGSTKTKAP
jgi:REP element-mobilizing transposase RayT